MAFGAVALKVAIATPIAFSGDDLLWYWVTQQRLVTN